MTRYLLRRTAASLVLVWVVLTTVFVALHAAPGDPFSRLTDPRIPPTQRERLRAIYGLDRPLPVQYGAWLTAWARGDWGTSFFYQRPVSQVLASKTAPTLLLGVSAFVVQFALGGALGVAAATGRRGARDRWLRLVTVALYSLPTFWVALMLALVMSRELGWFPAAGLSSPFAEEWGALRYALDVAHHLVLPALALGVPPSAFVARLVRNQLLDELARGYVTAARARGLGEARVLLHAARNATAPLIQLAGISLPLLLGGAVVVETVFGWPGLGSTLYEAIQARDYPLVLGLAGVSAFLVIAGNLVADLLLAALDPRVTLDPLEAA
ncbi:MAG TPA: ABC transporter permease [Thermoanaerobaculia bacterium]|nr:ABC transporter permease [Thermoanaerobaculia bacterium]